MATPPVTYPFEIGRALVSDEDYPRQAVWSYSGRVIVTAGNSTATVSKLPNSLAGKPVLVSIGSSGQNATTNNIVFGVGVVTAGPEYADLTLTCYGNNGSEITTTADINLVWMILG